MHHVRQENLPFVTYREREGEEVVRIISARKATPRERNMYEESL